VTSSSTIIADCTISYRQNPAFKSLTSRRGHALVQQFGVCPLPNFLDDSAQLTVAVINVAICFYPQRRSHHGKEGCVEQHCAVAVQRHVHRHEPLFKNFNYIQAWVIFSDFIVQFAVRPSRLSKNYRMLCYSFGIPKFVENLDGRTANFVNVEINPEYATCAAARACRLHSSIKFRADADLASHSVRTQFAEAERR
jgi:hypothetical protein